MCALDGREFTAKIVGTDPPTDVAIIQIDARNFPCCPWGFGQHDG